MNAGADANHFPALHCHDIILVSNIPLEDLRREYQAAVKTEGALAVLQSLLAAAHEHSGIEQAYRASAEALLGRYSWNPATKLRQVQEANRIFRIAVRLDPQNVEIRFLRFAIQHYLPSFLAESINLEEDKAVILAHLHRYEEFELSREHVASFLDFFEQSKRFTPEELAALAQILSQ